MSDLRTELAVAIERPTEAVGTSRSDVADRAAITVNIGDLRCLLRSTEPAEPTADREALIDLLAMSPMGKYVAPFIGPVERTADTAIAAGWRKA